MRIFNLVTFLLFANLAFGQLNLQLLSKKPISIGEAIEIKSEILNEVRTLNIYLPPDYDADLTQKFPVIYLLDGGIYGDFIHVVGLVQFMSFPWIKMIPQSIVVGIENVDRKRDFTYPTTIPADLVDFPTTGHSDNFIKFIEQELQPFIEMNYHVSEMSTIIGQSFGGLLATEILFKKPELFDHYIIVSPSLWWDNQSLMQIKRKVSQVKSIFIGVGKEGEIMENDAKSLFKSLKSEGNVSFKFLKEQNHGDALHLAVYSAFENFNKK